MKILHLILYSNISDGINNEDIIYEKMKNIQEQYYNIYEPNVKTYYIKYNKNDDNHEYVLQGNILHINGDESNIPGILDKTIKSLEYFKNIKYDYLVRSNISTIINFENLICELHKNPINFYGGGTLIDLQWKGNGINDETFFGTLFAQGTSIILTNEAANFLLENKDLLKYDIVDDVSIGIFMKENRKDFLPEEIDKKYYVIMPCFLYQIDNKYENIKSHYENRNIIFYRNKHINDRNLDFMQMNILISLLLDKKI